MSILATLLDPETKTTPNFQCREMTVVPRLRLVVLTCLDPRVDPAHFLGLKLGDAKVLRNVGGQVTDDVIRDLAFAAALLKQVAGEALALELAIVRHTECGASRLADPAFRETINSESGIDRETLMGMAIEDHRGSILEDIQQLAASSLCPPTLSVSGHLYDVQSGTVSELVALRRLN